MRDIRNQDGKAVGFDLRGRGNEPGLITSVEEGAVVERIECGLPRLGR